MQNDGSPPGGALTGWLGDLSTMPSCRFAYPQVAT